MAKFTLRLFVQGELLRSVQVGILPKYNVGEKFTFEPVDNEGESFTIQAVRETEAGLDVYLSDGSASNNAHLN